MLLHQGLDVTIFHQVLPDGYADPKLLSQLGYGNFFTIPFRQKTLKPSIGGFVALI